MNIFKLLNFSAVILFSISSYSQQLPQIAITEIKASVDSRAWRDYKNSKAVNFQTMLETQLTQTNRFKIIERNRIGEVLSEQALQGEFSGNGTVMKVGAVDYIVYGSITKFGSKEKRVATSGISVVKIISEFGVDLKVVDVLTGEVRKAETVELSMEVGSGTRTQGFGTSDVKADPLSDIQRAAAKLAAATIAESIFPIKVAAWDDEGQNCCGYLNYGDAILSVGDQLRIMKQGKAFVDPDTGISLGAREREIAKIKVIEVTDQFSKIELIDGTKPTGGELARTIPGQIQGNQPTQQRQRQGRKI
jgi:curli biogenesis system outer membrane secretion channel CsgG